MMVHIQDDAHTARVRSTPRAERAARFAHEHGNTRDRAAAVYRVRVEAVLRAWNRLFPESRRRRVP